MIWLVLALLVAWVAIGPWVLAAVVVALFVPRLRWWCQDRFWVDRRRGAVTIAAVAVVGGLVVLVPDAWLPVPQSPGLMVTPSYVGRPVAARPVQVDVPQNPHLARNGASSRHNDAAASGAHTWPGPAGHEPEVDTAWLGVERCATLAFDAHDRLITPCRDLDGPALHVLDPESMRKLATKDLPHRADGDEGPRSSCGETPLYLDAVDRAVVATADRRIMAIGTSDADGEPDLTTDQTWDLTGAVPKGDCLVALLPDWAGRIWFGTHDGLVGTLAPATGEVRTFDLGEAITGSLATDETGGTYVVTTRALYRLTAGVGGAPVVEWRAEQDRGGEQADRSGQGIGTTPTILDGGVVAITEDADAHVIVVFHERSTGREICRRPVFEADGSTSHHSVVAVGDGVIVDHGGGDDGPVSTLLGRVTSPGLARVDIAGGACRLVWSNDEIATSGMAKVSLASGLVYAHTKRPNWWGVSAWYLTAIDATTGRIVFAVRTGTGILMNNHAGALSIAPDGAAWIATLAGLVRVRDRVRD